jgi:hypothetical protein
MDRDKESTVHCSAIRHQCVHMCVLAGSVLGGWSDVRNLCFPIEVSDVIASWMILTFYLGGRALGSSVSVHCSDLRLRNSNQAELGLPCRRHPSSTECKLPEPGQVDIMVGSGPCQPYSNLRHSGFAKPPEEHSGYSATFGEVGSITSVCQKVLPRYFITEQVLGFSKPGNKDHPEINPKTEFIGQVMSILTPEGLSHFHKCISLQLDSKLFIQAGRPRFLGRRFAFGWQVSLALCWS